MSRHIGLDAGSVSVKLAVLDGNGNVIKTRYVRHRGNPCLLAYELLREEEPATLSITGTSGRLIAEMFLSPCKERDRDGWRGFKTPHH